MTIDMNKKYRTRDGSEVRVYATDGMELSPVHRAYLKDGKWILTSWAKDGRHDFFSFNQGLDLIEVREKRVAYLNVYEHEVGAFYENRKDADEGASGLSSRIACIRVEYEEGQFDE